MKYLQAVLAIGLVAGAGVVLAQSAGPTPHQVYEAARSGHLAQAQQMIDQVLRDHPRSGDAHYVAAEVYARQGNLARARQELATAEQLKPGLPNADPRSLQELRSELAQTQGRPGFAVPYSRPHSSGIPCGFILIVGAGLAVLWMVIRRRTAAATSYQQYASGPVAAGPGNGPGYGPGAGYGPGYGGSGLGSGIAGGLASGLAVGAGVVAGEELARHFLNSGQPTGGAPLVEEPPVDPNADMGGSDFGLSDSGSWDDSSGGGGFDSGGGGGDDWT
jgi:uncharacterized protein